MFSRARCNYKVPAPESLALVRGMGRAVGCVLSLRLPIEKECVVNPFPVGPAHEKELLRH